MPLFRRQKILTIKDQLVVENAKLMFRVHNEMCPVPVLNIYYNVNSTSATRGKGIKIRPHVTQKVNKSFICKPVVDWLKVPMECKNVESPKLFTKKFKLNAFKRYWVTM